MKGCFNRLQNAHIKGTIVWGCTEVYHCVKVLGNAKKRKEKSSLSFAFCYVSVSVFYSYLMKKCINVYWHLLFIFPASLLSFLLARSLLFHSFFPSFLPSLFIFLLPLFILYSLFVCFLFVYLFVYSLFVSFSSNSSCLVSLSLLSSCFASPSDFLSLHHFLSSRSFLFTNSSRHSSSSLFLHLFPFFLQLKTRPDRRSQSDRPNAVIQIVSRRWCRRMQVLVVMALFVYIKASQFLVQSSYFSSSF